MDFITIAKQRMSVRSYKETKVEPEKLKKILEAAHVAPPPAQPPAGSPDLLFRARKVLQRSARRPTSTVHPWPLSSAPITIRRGTAFRSEADR